MPEARPAALNREPGASRLGERLRTALEDRQRLLAALEDRQRLSVELRPGARPAGFIKICGLTRAVDVAVAVEAGADALGFVLARSPHQVTPAQVSELRRGVPAAMLSIGVFVAADAREIDALVSRLGLDGAQLHGSDEAAETPACALLKALGMAPDAAAAPLAAAHAWQARSVGLLLDTALPGKIGGTGRRFAWHKVPELLAALPATPVVIAGGLTPGSVAEAIAASGAAGVDVSSGVESRPGVKDAGKIRDFIAAARAAFAARATASRK